MITLIIAYFRFSDHNTISRTYYNELLIISKTNEQSNRIIRSTRYHNKPKFSNSESYEIMDCIFQKCDSNLSLSDGGAIFFDSNNRKIDFVVIERCGFRYCSSKNGGAICIINTNAKISSCHFFRCSASEQGLCFYIRGKVHGENITFQGEYIHCERNSGSGESGVSLQTSKAQLEHFNVSKTHLPQGHSSGFAAQDCIFCRAKFFCLYGVETKNLMRFSWINGKVISKCYIFINCTSHDSLIRVSSCFSSFTFSDIYFKNVIGKIFIGSQTQSVVFQNCITNEIIETNYFIKATVTDMHFRPLAIPHFKIQRGEIDQAWKLSNQITYTYTFNPTHSFSPSSVFSPSNTLAFEYNDLEYKEVIQLRKSIKASSIILLTSILDNDVMRL